MSRLFALFRFVAFVFLHLSSLAACAMCNVLYFIFPIYDTRLVGREWAVGGGGGPFRLLPRCGSRVYARATSPIGGSGPVNGLGFSRLSKVFVLKPSD